MSLPRSTQIHPDPPSCYPDPPSCYPDPPSSAQLATQIHPVATQLQPSLCPVLLPVSTQFSPYGGGLGESRPAQISCTQFDTQFPPSFHPVFTLCGGLCESRPAQISCTQFATQFVLELGTNWVGFPPNWVATGWIWVATGRIWVGFPPNWVDLGSNWAELGGSGWIWVGSPSSHPVRYYKNSTLPERKGSTAAIMRVDSREVECTRPQE